MFLTVEAFKPPTDQSEIVTTEFQLRQEEVGDFLLSKSLRYRQMVFFKFLLALGAHPAPGTSLLFHRKM